MKNDNRQTTAESIRVIEEELRIACKILEWEIGDIWGHVGVRLPENKGIDDRDLIAELQQPRRYKRSYHLPIHTSHCCQRQ